MRGTTAILLRELNSYRVVLNKRPIKRWRSTREKLVTELERLADQVIALRKKTK